MKGRVPGTGMDVPHSTEPDCIVHLTRRQLQIIVLLTRGYRNKCVGAALGITEGSVKVYLSKIYDKLGCSDRLSVALHALQTIGVANIELALAFVPVPIPKRVPRPKAPQVAESIKRESIPKPPKVDVKTLRQLDDEKWNRIFEENHGKFRDDRTTSGLGSTLRPQGTGDLRALRRRTPFVPNDL